MAMSKLLKWSFLAGSLCILSACYVTLAGAQEAYQV